ncbi:MAG: soluble lytic murein transglycosylase [Janthinobacterium sp.]|jgi:soluble lytic murein transglycosylase
MCAASAVLAGGGVGTQADDNAFLLLRDAVRQDNASKAEFYAARMSSREFAPYLDYYRLKVRLKDATVVEIRDFLTLYAGSAIADRLRNDWLLLLGRARDWATFDEQYSQFILDDDTQLKCYALQSRIVKRLRAATEARALLLAPPTYGDACGDLIVALAQSGQFDADDLWTQIRLAGEFDATGPARRIAALLDVSATKLAQAIDLPAIALAKGLGDGRAAHEIYLVAVGRMARTSVNLAVLALEKAAPRLTATEQATGWASIALAASYKLAPETGQYWARSQGAPLSLDAQQWKTRIALRDGNWRQVKATIEAMPSPLRDDPAWVYWLGRALQQQDADVVRTAAKARPAGINPESAQLYARIADETNFYGQLAAEELGRLSAIPPSGKPITPAELAAMAAKPGFQRALRFFGMGLRFEGTREWNWELRKMSEREYLAAAELARTHNILDRMVNTSDRTRTDVDYTQRFPSPHDDIMHPATQTLGLDKAWVYGLIRQESRFIMDAQSHAGASGLMQVMPSTASYVAKKIGLTDFAQHMLNDVRTNILLGTNYLYMVLGGFDGSQALATAAYNAGPGRLRGWRGTFPGSMEGAIFAESIPFTETRTYVKNVMSNATYYAALFEKRPQSLKTRLGTVAPKGYPAAAERD